MTEPVHIPADGVELFTGQRVTGSVTVPEGGVAVVREPITPGGE